MEADQSLSRWPFHPARPLIQPADLLVTIEELPHSILSRCTQSDWVAAECLTDFVNGAAKPNLPDTIRLPHFKVSSILDRWQRL